MFNYIVIILITHPRDPMFKYYAYFSVNYPLIHKINILIIMSIFMVSVYQLLINEALIYFSGFFVTLIAIVVFSRSSIYKTKYLNTKR